MTLEEIKNKKRFFLNIYGKAVQFDICEIDEQKENIYVKICTSRVYDREIKFYGQITGSFWGEHFFLFLDSKIINGEFVIYDNFWQCKYESNSDARAVDIEQYQFYRLYDEKKYEADEQEELERIKRICDGVFESGDIKTYIAKDNFGNYKIGKTIHLSVRKRELQKVATETKLSYIPTIEFVAVFVGDKEKYLHEKYCNFRINGEWFKFTDEGIKKLIEEEKFVMLEDIDAPIFLKHENKYRNATLYERVNKNYEL